MTATSASREKIAFAYTLAVASYDAACEWDDAERNDALSAKRANRAYRVSALWLRAHDLPAIGVAFQGATIADFFRVGDRAHSFLRLYESFIGDLPGRFCPKCGCDIIGNDPHCSGCPVDADAE
jgi:hypothetical protein